MPSSRKLFLLGAGAYLLLAVVGCDAVEPTAPTPPSPPTFPELQAELSASNQPCSIAGGFYVRVQTAAAYGEGGVSVAANGNEAVTCEGGPTPLWTLNGDGSVASTRSHPFEWPAQLVGGDGGFYAFEVDEGEVALSWMTTEGDVVSTTTVASLPAPSSASGLKVRPVRDADAATGISSFFLYVGDALYAVTAGGGVRWSLPSPPRHEDLFPTGDGGAVLVRGSGGDRDPAARAVRIDGQGGVVWEREYAPAGSWESLAIERVLPTDDGYWALGRAHGYNFSHLLVLKLDASGEEVGRTTLPKLTARTVYAREVGAGLTALVATGYPNGSSGQVFWVDVAPDGLSLTERPAPLQGSFVLHDLSDVGDGRLFGHRTVANFGCMNAAGGCSGDAGYFVQTFQVTGAG